ncbi:MAG: hypothetical protein HYY20_04420 [Candidatus Tectomicrobia bacterium]|uniref:Uncharacterized protein n=1 Tax=Tectimicrobiota bacterium TaxID=2528274 RepID=A0A932FUY0_UNCTE|nr:hypothetical protein [Candidatus Tectomicrobia bacterium]
MANSTGGGTEQLEGVHADPRRLTEPELSYGHYSGMTTDTYAPIEDDVLNFINAVEQATGFPLMLYNYDSEIALGKLQPGLNKIQIIHNVRLPNPLVKSLFTFIFPPAWQPSQPSPILLSGTGWLFSNAGNILSPV